MHPTNTIHPSAWRNCLKSPDRYRTSILPSAENGSTGLYLGAARYRRATIEASPATFQTVSPRTWVNRERAWPRSGARACRCVLDGPLEGVVGDLLPAGLAHGEVGAALELLVVGDRFGAPIVLGVGLVDRRRHDVVLAARDNQ